VVCDQISWRGNKNGVVSAHVLDHYQGTELGRLLTVYATDQQKVASLSSKRKYDVQIQDRIWNEALEQQGFGPDALDTASDPLIS
jgi:hypothetical protein